MKKDSSKDIAEESGQMPFGASFGFASRSSSHQASPEALHEPTRTPMFRASPDML